MKCYDYDDVVNALESIKKDINIIVNEHTGNEEDKLDKTIDYENTCIREKRDFLISALNNASEIAKSLNEHTN